MRSAKSGRHFVRYLAAIGFASTSVDVRLERYSDWDGDRSYK
jgi:hypothetical protein